MKSITFALALALATATTAQAGSAVYIAPEAAAIEAPLANAATNWIIPLVIIGIVVLVATDDNCSRVISAEQLAPVQDPCK